MNDRVFAVDLQSGYNDLLHVGLSQYDVGVVLEFDVFDGGAAAVFPSGTTAKIQGVRPSGVGFDISCTLNGNVVTVSTVTDMTGEAGSFPVEIRFTASGVDVGTVNFVFQIEKAAHPDGTIDADITHEQDIVDKINQILVQTTPDPTLSESGKAADAAATGQAIEIANESIRILGASLNTRINNVDSDVRKKAPVIWKEASGNPVIVEDGAGYVKDRAAQMYAFNVAVDFEPVQDFNGYDYAWAGGNGKNKLPYFANSDTRNGLTLTPLEGGAVRVNGTATATTVFFQSEYVDTWASGDYILSGCPTGGSASTYFMRMYRTGGNTLATDTGSGATFTGQTGLSAAIVVINGTTLNNVTFYPMIRLATESDATYAPYSNICPINGAESVTVKRTGKNMLENIGTSATINGVTFTVNADRSVSTSGTASGRAEFWITGSGFYEDVNPLNNTVLTGCPEGGGEGKYAVLLRQYGTNPFPASYDFGRGISISMEEGAKRFAVAIVIYSGQNANGLTFRPMIRPASISDDTYEPYNVQTVSINLGGEYYGGTIDIATGQLEVTWQSFTFDGSSDEDWASYSETGRTWPTLWVIPSVSGIDYTAKPYCETWRTKISTPTKDELGSIGIAQQSPAGFIDVRPPVDYATKAEWRTYLAANPITIWVKMKEPITVGTLDWYDLEMLYKYNVLTTDGTNIRLVYPVDTKIYIDNAIAAISG